MNSYVCGKLSYSNEAKAAMEKVRDASDNEELFQAQKRLREICVIFVDAGLQAIDGTRESS